MAHEYGIMLHKKLAMGMMKDNHYKNGGKVKKNGKKKEWEMKKKDY